MIMSTGCQALSKLFLKSPSTSARAISEVDSAANVLMARHKLGEEIALHVGLKSVACAEAIGINAIQIPIAMTRSDFLMSLIQGGL